MAAAARGKGEKWGGNRQEELRQVSGSRGAGWRVVDLSEEAKGGDRVSRGHRCNRAAVLGREAVCTARVSTNREAERCGRRE